MNDGWAHRGRATRLSAAVLVGTMVGTTTASGNPQQRSNPDRAAFDPMVHVLPGVALVPTDLGMRRHRVAQALPGESGDDGDASVQPSSDPIDALPDRYGGDRRTTSRAQSRAERNRRHERDIFGQKPLSDRVIFRVNLGYGIDGGTPQQSSDTAPLRTYYYGDLVIGSRGLGAPNLSTYLASQFRFDLAASDEQAPVPSLFYSSPSGPYGTRDPRDVWIRSAYGTWQGVSDKRALQPLFIRLGRQFRYGPAIAHFDGMTIGYDTPAVSAAAFVGAAADVTGVNVAPPPGISTGILGLDARLDLYRIASVPLVLSGELLSFAESTHVRGSLALRINRDVALGASVRMRDQKVARTGVRLRARVRRVTLIDVQVENRSSDDWMYDVFASGASLNSARLGSPLNYFSLGSVVPRLYLAARAGTVLLRNIDVLAHGRAAIRQGSDELRSPHASSFAQGGAAIEVHVRRAVNLGLGFLARKYWRPEPIDSGDTPPVLEELEATSDGFGERSFFEGNATVRYSQGARKFSAGAELYLRRYDFQSAYELPDAIFDDQDTDNRLDGDLRGGGRFSVEGWAGDNLRLRAEYDITTELVVAPELKGIKSLRILAEGRF